MPGLSGLTVSVQIERRPTEPRQPYECTSGYFELADHSAQGSMLKAITTLLENCKLPLPGK